MVCTWLQSVVYNVVLNSWIYMSYSVLIKLHKFKLLLHDKCPGTEFLWLD